MMTLLYEESGNLSGPLLLFIHGGGTGPWMWSRQVDAFCDYHVIIPTLQGHGRRSNDDSFSIAQNALELLELVEDKGKGKPVHLAGFSIGAQIALTMLSLAPASIQTAVINSASVIPMKRAIPFIPAMIRLTMPLIQRRSFAKLQAKQLDLDGEYFDAYYEDSRKMKAQTLIDMLTENMAFTIPDNFSKSTAAIYVTVGEQEHRHMKKSAALLAEQHTNCRSLIISSTGHGFPVAKPELFTQLVKGWLEKS